DAGDVFIARSNLLSDAPCHLYLAHMILARIRMGGLNHQACIFAQLLSYFGSRSLIPVRPVRSAAYNDVAGRVTGSIYYRRLNVVIGPEGGVWCCCRRCRVDCIMYIAIPS